MNRRIRLFNDALNVAEKAGRAFKPMIDERMIHRWRDAWRKSMGNCPTLLGNEVCRP